MEINRETFIGSWNVYADATISQLELQPGGRYLHTLWDGVQSHWGFWSIQQDGGFAILRLELQGAQPETYNGPFGVVKLQWPPVEAWVINGILPNQIAIQGGLLIRRSLIAPLGQPPVTSNATQAPSSPTTQVDNPTASASNPEGKALIAKVIEAAGGAAALNAIHTLRAKSAVTETAQEMTMEVEITWVFPDKIHAIINTPSAEIVQVITPQDSFWIGKGQATGTEVKPVAPFQHDNLLHALRRSLPYVVQHMSDFVFSVQGTEQLGNVLAPVLDISGEGGQWRCCIDPQNGHVLRTQCQVAAETGPVTVIVNFSNWKLTNGLTFPFRSESTRNGQPAESVVVRSYEVNPTVDPKIFTRQPNMAAAQPLGAPAPGQPLVHPQFAPNPAMRAVAAPPPLPMPNNQFANILKQWADLHEATLQAAREANLASSTAAHNFAKKFIAYAAS